MSNRNPAIYFVPEGSNRALCPACAKAEGVSRGISTRRFNAGPGFLKCAGCACDIPRVHVPAAQGVEAPAPEPMPAAAPTPAPSPEPTNLATHGLFGFQPLPATGRQRSLFDYQSTPTDAAWPAAKPSSVLPTFPRPWSKSTAADARIAKKFKADATPPGLF